MLLQASSSEISPEPKASPQHLGSADRRRSRRKTVGGELLSVAVQNALAATIVDDALRMLHAWEGTGPPLGVLLHGEAPTVSRLPLR